MHDHSSHTNNTNPANEPQIIADITEFDPQWTDAQGSTHELVITKDFIFVSGQKMDQIAQFDYSGRLLSHFNMPKGSGPHGLMLDKQEQLWVSLEFFGKVIRLDSEGNTVEEIDVNMYINGTTKPINPAPHGICLGADGETIWFTGKRTSTIGKINPNRTVEHFQLENLGAVPIFLNAGPDGNVWGTELQTSAILNISPDGNVYEYKTPTTNSRPIGIIPDPSDAFMWFTEEAGKKVGRIDMSGHINEFAVPVLQENDILGSLSFDREMNLWVQVYAAMNHSMTPGKDYIMKFDKSFRNINLKQKQSLSPYLISIHVVPSKMSMLHRIRMDHTGNLWFTEMMTDKLGKITLEEDTLRQM